MTIDRTPLKSEEHPGAPKPEHSAAHGDNTGEQGGTAKPEPQGLTLSDVSWKDHQAALKTFEGGSSTVALAQLDFHPLPTDHFGLPANAEQQKQIKDADAASLHDRFVINGAGGFSNDNPEARKHLTEAMQNSASESLDRYTRLGDLKNHLSNNQTTIDSIRQRDALSVVRAAGVEFNNGNDRDSARALVHKLYKTMGSDAEKFFATDEAKILTDALGMTKGAPFKELDATKIAQDISNAAFKALGGDSAAEKQLQQKVKELAPETLYNVAALLQKSWGHDAKGTLGVTASLDSKDDVMDLTFHSNSGGLLSKSSEVKVLTGNVYNKNVDYGAAAKLQEEYNHLDPKIRQLLEKNGTHVVVATKATDVDPSFTDSILGFAKHGGDVVVGERSTGPNSQPNPDPAETLRHEVGHKLDELLSGNKHNLTDSEEFLRLYALDQQDLFRNNDWNNATAKQFLKYDDPERGQNELAAEAFAKILGHQGDKERSREDQWFETHFVRSQRFLEDKLNAFLHQN